MSDYYISPNGNNANTGTVETDPWKTFDYVVAKLQPNDTLLLLNGTYTEELRVKNRDGPITIKAQNEKEAILQGVLIEKSNNCNLTDLKVLGSTGYGVHLAYSSNCVLENLIILDSGLHGVVLEGSNNCELRRLEVRRPNNTTNSHGIILSNYSTNNTVEYCIVREFHRDGIQMYWSQYNTIRYCYVSGDMRQNNHKFGVTGGISGISCYFGDDNTIENCLSMDVSVGFENKGCSRNKFLNCVAFHSPTYIDPKKPNGADVNNHFLSGFYCTSFWHPDIKDWLLSEGISFVNCIAHGNSHGFCFDGVASATLIRCESSSNKINGYLITNNVTGGSLNNIKVPKVSAFFRECKAWKNGVYGWYFEGKQTYKKPTSYFLEDCRSFANKVKNCRNDLPKGKVVSVPLI